MKPTTETTDEQIVTGLLKLLANHRWGRDNTPYLETLALSMTDIKVHLKRLKIHPYELDRTKWPHDEAEWRQALNEKIPNTFRCSDADRIGRIVGDMLEQGLVEKAFDNVKRGYRITRKGAEAINDTFLIAAFDHPMTLAQAEALLAKKPEPAASVSQEHATTHTSGDELWQSVTGSTISASDARLLGLGVAPKFDGPKKR